VGAHQKSWLITNSAKEQWITKEAHWSSVTVTRTERCSHWTPVTLPPSHRNTQISSQAAKQKKITLFYKEGRQEEKRGGQQGNSKSQNRNTTCCDKTEAGNSFRAQGFYTTW